MSLEAAEAILTAEGAGALSVRRIAQSIGYTHGTLERAGAAAPAGADRLHALARGYLDFATENPARWRLVFEHHLPPGQQTPDWLTGKIARAHAVLDAALAGCGLAAHARSALGLALWCAIHGVTVLALDGKLVDASGEAVAPEPVLRSTVTTFLTGAG